MNAQTPLIDRPLTVAIGSVTSADGTTIGYRRLGQGPGLVVLHGAMESSQSHLQLAEELASEFTAYLPDRRGRGLSGPFGTGYSIAKEIADLDALLTATGALQVLGVSSGALIALQAALTLPTLRKVAIFEPPMLVDRTALTASLVRFDQEIADGRFTAALITGMHAAEMGPPIFNLIPRWPLEQLTNMAMASEDRKAGDGAVKMRLLAPTLHYDFQLITELEGMPERFGAIEAELLLLGGGKSPAYLHASVDALQKVLPRAIRVEFPGLDHGATGNRDRGGRPELVAKTLGEFYG